MTVYPDPSVLVSAFVDEPHSQLAAAFLGSLTVGEVLTSWWADVEVTSALGVKSRVGGLRPELGATIMADIRAVMRQVATTVTPTAQDFQHASGLMEQTAAPLRGGDALHLAIAAGRDAVVWTLDRRMANVGQALGLRTRLLA